MEELIRKSLKKNAKSHLLRSAGCPSELELARYLEGACLLDKRQHIEKHLADCSYCLDLLVVTRDILKKEAVSKAPWRKKLAGQKWLILTLISFVLSFAVKRYFLQFLFIGLILGIRWALSAEGSRNLVMIFRGLSHKESNSRKPEEKIFERK